MAKRGSTTTSSATGTLLQALALHKNKLPQEATHESITKNKSLEQTGYQFDFTTMKGDIISNMKKVAKIRY